MKTVLNEADQDGVDRQKLLADWPANIIRLSMIIVVSFIIITGSIYSSYYYVIRDAQKINESNTEQIVKQTINQIDKNLHKIDDREKVNILTDIIIQFKPKVSKCLVKPIAANILNECKARDMDPFLITALIYIESMFDTVALSSKGAMGLMQVQYSTWKDTQILKKYGVKCANDLYRPFINIKCGIDIFKKYYKESNYDVAKTLYRYNSGATTLNKNPFEVEYINKIMYYHYLILSMFNEKLINKKKRHQNE